ncbi:hypothetical protein AAFF_G00008980 [Aldrovandia affinis]|uniref:PEHE domain-containing protein n=1 Tax=Aldrovandia affinis TaxID=143900 RepID=A0AAD7WZX7_9TELE|nr:hypothetical protein AAFF_G00008980 [Aldrovandia affinis]
MAPALTETATDSSRGVHLSSPLGSMDGSLLVMDLDPPEDLMEDDCAWLNRTFMSSPDACSKDALNLQTLFLSPLVQSPGSCRTMPHSSPGTILNFLSPNKSLSSPLLPCLEDLDLYLLSVPEQDDQDDQDAMHCFWNTSPQQSPLRKYCLGGSEPLAYSTLLAPPPVKGGREVDCGRTQAQSGSVGLEGAVLGRTQGCHDRQHALLGQITQTQKRLQALLGGHASRHCSLQLGGLIEACSGGDSPARSVFPLKPHSPLDIKPFDTPMELEEDEQGGPWSRLTVSHPPPKVPSPVEVQTFISCAQGVMSTLQDALDSDATDSSTDDELDLEGAQGTSCVPVDLEGEWRWQAERAEISSRWMWLQSRVSQLEFQTQHLSNFQQHISSTKTGVVLGKTRRVMEKSVKQTPSALDLTPDTDLEASSPARLLRNIERQSAQLTEIVNSLMPPFSLSPSSSPTATPSGRRRKRRRRRGQCLQGDPPFPGQVEQKRKPVYRRRRRSCQVDSTCIAARTRPLMTYCKPRLFTMDPPTCPRRQQSPEPGPSCDTAAYARPSSPRNPLSSGRCQGAEHPVLSLTSEIPVPVLLKSALYRGERFPRQARVKSQESRWSCCENKEPLLERGRTKVQGTRGKSTPAAQGHRGRPFPRGGKRGPNSGTAEDESAFWSHLSEPSYCNPLTHGTPSDLMTPHAAQTHSVQGVACQHPHGDFISDNVCIPTSLTASSKIEQQQYKDVITPSWRIVKYSSLEVMEGGEDEMEDLSDEAFSRRHQAGEIQERQSVLPFGLEWIQKKSCKSSGGNAGKADSSALSMVDHAQPAADTENSLHDSAFQLSWEQRVFPLCEEEEENLTPVKHWATLQSDSEEVESSGTDTCSEHSFSYYFSPSPSTEDTRAFLEVVTDGERPSFFGTPEELWMATP